MNLFLDAISNQMRLMNGDLNNNKSTMNGDLTPSVKLPQPQWPNKGQGKTKLKKQHVFTNIAKTFWFYFLVPSFIKLVADILQLVSPMILK